MIYLDNNATTRPAPEVVEAMAPFLTEIYGNPSSAHELGRAARQAVERAREAVAAMLGAAIPGEIVFTSGGTESDNWAITAALSGANKRHIITTQVEHEAVRNLADRLENEGVRVTRLGVDELGNIDLEQLRSELFPETTVVSVMHANNETGVLFPIREIASIVKEHSGALVHVDGVNAAGKIPIDLKSTEIDLYSISGHKFHGPKGIGALYVRSGVELLPWFTGGGQESGKRAGTEAVHQIAGLGAAAELVQDMGTMERVRGLRDELESRVLENIPNSRVNGNPNPERRLPNTSNISFENANGEVIMARLNDMGIYVSTGSACASADHTASPVLQAMEVPYSYAAGSIRFSLGRYNEMSDIEAVLECLPQIVGDLRRMAAAD